MGKRGPPTRFRDAYHQVCRERMQEYRKKKSTPMKLMKYVTWGQRLKEINEKLMDSRVHVYGKLPKNSPICKQHEKAIKYLSEAGNHLEELMFLELRDTLFKIDEDAEILTHIFHGPLNDKRLWDWLVSVMNKEIVTT